MSNSLVVVGVVIVIQLVKWFEAKFVKVLGERSKDIVYSLAGVVLIGLANFLGLVDTTSLNELLPLLVAPQGLFIVIKKLFGRS